MPIIISSVVAAALITGTATVTAASIAGTATVLTALIGASAVVTVALINRPKGDGLVDAYNWMMGLTSKYLFFGEERVDEITMLGPNRCITFTTTPSSIPILLRIGMINPTIHVQGRSETHSFEATYMTYQTLLSGAFNEIDLADDSKVYTQLNILNLGTPTTTSGLGITARVNESNNFELYTHDQTDDTIPIESTWRIMITAS